jgi:hypothetical protein
MALMLRVNRVANAAVLAATTPYQFTADHHKVVSVQAVWTVTTASATATLQLSNDGVTWDTFTTATAITASGNVSWYLDSKDALYVRVLYTHTSGSSDTFKAYMAYVPR